MGQKRTVPCQCRVIGAFLVYVDSTAIDEGVIIHMNIYYCIDKERLDILTDRVRF